MDKPFVTIDDAPRCPKCDYVLLGLTEFRCPECGTPFDREYLEEGSFRVHLLPWERPEAGGRVKRLTRTLVQASLHPGRFFGDVSQRKERRVGRAGSLIGAYTLVSLCFYVVAFLVDHTAFFVRLLVRQGRPSQALDTVLRTLSISWSVELLLPFMQFLSTLLSVAVMAGLINRIFRVKLGSLRTLDIAAFLSSAVALGALIMAFAQVVSAVSFNTLSFVLSWALFADLVVLLPLVWFTSRRVMSLSRRKAAAMVVVSGIVEFGCGAVVGWLLFTLPVYISAGIL